MKKFTYKNPSTIDEAITFLGKNWSDAKILAGGSDLVGMMKNDNIYPKQVVSLKYLKGYDYVKNGSRGITIGALAKLNDIIDNSQVNNGYSLLSQAASVVGTPQLRNMGTLGGNICQRPRCKYFRGNFPCMRNGGDECSAIIGDNRNHCIFGGGPCFIIHPSDTSTALMALGAQLNIEGPNGSRKVPIEKFFVLPEENIMRENILKPDEIITEISIPPQPENSTQIFKKFMRRSSWDFAVVSVAVILSREGNTCREIKLVLGGVAPKPWRVPKAEEFFKGKSINENNIERVAEIALEGAQPLEKNSYKIELTKNMIKDILLNN